MSKVPVVAPDEKIDEAKPVEHSFDFKPIDYHEWHQEGTTLICTSCPHSHSANIKPGLILTKKDGKFTLVSIEEDEKARSIE